MEIQAQTVKVEEGVFNHNVHNVVHNQANDFQPNQTLYVNNLNEKIKVDELKQAIFHLFSQYGEILEVHAKKTLKLRGQAFIVFRDLNSSSLAKHSLNGTLLFGKDMKINFAKTSSDTIAKLNGTYIHKDKVKRDMENKRKREEELKAYKKKKEEKDKINQKKEKEVKKEGVDPKRMPVLTPNNILFIENLHPNISDPMLKNLFSQYLGFREVRLLSGKGIAFIEYDNEINAGTALVGLNGFQLTPECVLQISFAKK